MSRSYRYSEIILRYYENRLRVGQFADQSDCIAATAGSISSGEIMEVQIKLNAHKVIIDARYKVHGCGYAIAVCSYLSEWLIGKSLTEDHLSAEDMIKTLMLPENKYHSAMVAEDLLSNLKHKV